MTKDKIKHTRDRLGLSQSEFATLIGVHPLTVSRWERDEASPDGVAARFLEALSQKVERRKLPIDTSENLKGLILTVGAIAAFIWLMTVVFSGKK